MPHQIQPVAPSQHQSPFQLLAAVTPFMPLPSQPISLNSEDTAPTPTSPIQDASSSLSSLTVPSVTGPPLLSFPASPATSTRSDTTPLQDNPAAFVAAMISSQVPIAPSIVARRAENSLLQAGLNPPPPFPLYSGPSSPEVQVRGNSTYARRSQHLSTRNSDFVENLSVARNSRSGPTIARLKLLIFPTACPNNASPAQHISPIIHPDDPQPWSLEIWQKDIAVMVHRFEPIGLMVELIVHDGVVNFTDFHQAIARHQACSDSLKIPGFNFDLNTSYGDCGWCLQQMRTARGRTRLRCCQRAHTNATYWCLRTLTLNASMFKANVGHGEQADPALKNVFIIRQLPFEVQSNVLETYRRCSAYQRKHNP